MHCFSFASNLWIDWFTPPLHIYWSSHLVDVITVAVPSVAHNRGGFRSHQDESKSRQDLNLVTKWRQMTAWLRQDKERRVIEAWLQKPSIRRMRGESEMKVWLLQDEQLREFVDELWCCDWLQWRCDSDFFPFTSKLSLVQGWLGLIPQLWGFLGDSIDIIATKPKEKKRKFNDNHKCPYRLVPE